MKLAVTIEEGVDCSAMGMELQIGSQIGIIDQPNSLSPMKCGKKGKRNCLTDDCSIQVSGGLELHIRESERV